ncbi:MAG TPA: DUF2242 domain-containing protein [Candidatus Dormibacteraeota bacterium]|nr:DUF2242 domain-containing protein [Candidatus Dormibacteraeota bacterium]
MSSSKFTQGTGRCAVFVAAALLASGCAARKHELARDSISPRAPFSKTFTGSGDAVCWSVKRALLSQGYMLDRSNDNGVLTGTRDFQPNPKLNVSYRLQTTCADNRDGSSIVFVTAEREDSELQKMKQTTSVGVGPATLTMPSGSARVLGTVRRETITDPAFYNTFFTLVQGYVDQERLSKARDEERPRSSDRRGSDDRDRTDSSEPQDERPQQARNP